MEFSSKNNGAHCGSRNTLNLIRLILMQNARSQTPIMLASTKRSKLPNSEI